MNNCIFRLTLVALSACLANKIALAKDGEEQAFTVDKIVVQTYPIFDESDPETIALHELANRFHRVTRPWVVRERLSFSEGDSVTQADLIEAEAILRDQRYLRDARVRFDNSDAEETQVSVETWDRWPILPIIAASRRGGENRSALGFQHDNLLGLGVRTRVLYTDDEQRSGYQLTLQSALHWVRHANFRLDLADNDDGKRINLVVDKPFFHFDTKNRYFIQFFDDERVDDIDQNGNLRNSIAVDSHRYAAAYGWRLSGTEKAVHRMSVGLTDEVANFDIDPSSPTNDAAFLPFDRDFQYPWIAYEYTERNIAVLSNVFFIHQPEDINLGWNWRVQAGVSDGYHIQFSSRKAWLFGKHLALLNVSSRADIDAAERDHMRIDAHSQYFHRANDWLTLYGRVSTTFSDNPYRDQPIVLADNTGVRGYPLQYQYGDHRVSASAEARIYTDYDIYKFFKVGFAVFADAGRAFDGEFSDFNENDGVLSSVGIGTRLFSNRISATGVIHIDIASPLTSGENVDTWELRIQGRSAF